MRYASLFVIATGHYRQVMQASPEPSQAPGIRDFASPRSWDDVGDIWTRTVTYFTDPEVWLTAIGALVQVTILLVLAIVLIKVIDRATMRWTARVSDLPLVHPRRQRAFTISNLVNSIARYIIWPITIIMILGALHVNVGPLIATAGIAGLALGFGAQTLVKDVIGGIFLLFDDSIHVGDNVKIGSEAGVVEHIGVRLIKVRKFDGELLMVPAGELRIFGNRSIGFARLIVTVGLSYEQDIETVLPVMERVANEWADTRRHILMEENPSVQAIMDFGDSSVTARIVCRVNPGEQFGAEREIRLLLKREFDRLGIEIPFPRRTIYMREDKVLPPRSIPDQSDPASDSNGAAGSD
jgi:moderate conductance mechanosensitive channel